MIFWKHKPYGLATIPPGYGCRTLFKNTPNPDKYLGLDIITFGESGTCTGTGTNEERLFVLLNGQCTIQAQGLLKADLTRGNLFIDKPSAVYLGPRIDWRVTASAGTMILVPTAKSNQVRKAEAIYPSSILKKSVGHDNWKREVHNILPDISTISDRLIVGESIHPPGNWSGVPPHRHDKKGGNPFEEIYFVVVKPEQSYGVIVLYDEDQADPVLLRNNSALSFSSGFHPMVAAPGTTLYYLWAMAGPKKEFAVQLDENFTSTPPHTEVAA